MSERVRKSPAKLDDFVYFITAYEEAVRFRQRKMDSSYK